MQSFGFLAIVKGVLYHVYGESANIISKQNAIFMHPSKFEKTQVKINSPVSPCLAELTLIPAEKKKDKKKKHGPEANPHWVLDSEYFIVFHNFQSVGMYKSRSHEAVSCLQIWQSKSLRPRIDP